MRASRPSPYNKGMQKTQARIKESGDRKPGLVIHVPMAIFTAATVALTILNYNAMAIYFAVTKRGDAKPEEIEAAEAALRTAKTFLA